MCSRNLHGYQACQSVGFFFDTGKQSLAYVEPCGAIYHNNSDLLFVNQLPQIE